MLIQYEYAIENPKDFEGYGEDLWELTASYCIDDYAAHRPFDVDYDVITPTSAL